MTGSALDRAAAGGVRIAVVGSGPSGFYATEALLRSGTPLGGRDHVGGGGSGPPAVTGGTHRGVGPDVGLGVDLG